MDATHNRFIVVLVWLAASTTWAQEPGYSELHEQIEQLTKKVEALESRDTVPVWQQVQPVAPQPSVSCYCDPGTAAASKKPSYPTARLTGFFQADAGWFTQDALNRITPVNGVPIGDIQDGADFRRARLAAVGDLASNAGYMLEMDFAFPGRPTFMDVWAEIKDTFGPGTLRVGQFRHPFSMDALTSVKDLPLLERGLPFAFVPFRQIGAEYYGNNEAWDSTWAVSVFRYPTDPFGGNIGDNGGYGMATRWTCAPITYNNDRQLLHVGVDYSYANPSNDLIRYRNQPEFSVSETGGVPVGVPSNVPPFVDTGAMDSQDYQLFGVELASIAGPLYYQSEAMFSHVTRINAPNNDFWAHYAQLGYYLTGEVRPYNHKTGVMGRVDPFCPVKVGSGWGAWEIVGRWSYIDLNDGIVLGNELTTLSAGLNWYLNKNLKWQAMYSYSTLDSIPVGESNLDIYAMRIQIDF